MKHQGSAKVNDCNYLFFQIKCELITQLLCIHTHCVHFFPHIFCGCEWIWPAVTKSADWFSSRFVCFDRYFSPDWTRLQDLFTFILYFVFVKIMRCGHYLCVSCQTLYCLHVLLYTTRGKNIYIYKCGFSLNESDVLSTLSYTDRIWHFTYYNK